jgi:mono/diheme cytochrome c family protein
MTPPRTQRRTPSVPRRRSRLPLAAGLIAVLAIGLLALNLRGRGGNGGAPAGTADARDPRQVALGKQVYGQQCASCHGASLEGQPNWQAELPGGGRPAPPHDASGHTWHHSDQVLFDITKRGGQASSPPGYKNNMPAFGDMLSDEQIWAVLAYIKSTWPPEIRAAQEQANRQAQ